MIIFSMLLLTLLGLMGCDVKEDNQENMDEGSYKIYYIDTKTSELVSQVYQATSKDKLNLVEELLQGMRMEPTNILHKKVIPDNIQIKDLYFTGDDQLTIDFDSSYAEFTGIPEVLCRAAIVKTMSQIKDLIYVEFNVNGQSLLDINEVKVPLMKSDDFIDSTGTESSIPISLYFASKDGKSLIEYSSTVSFTGLNSMEESAIQQLINGPIGIGMYATIPEGTTLLNVTTKENVCYVDFNEKFLEKITDISDQVAIYSVVNTLVELPNVNKVQFLINGQVQKTYRESIPFSEMFEMNLEIIQGAK